MKRHSVLAFTKTQITEFERDGYVIVRGLFNREEIDIVNHVVNADPSIAAAIYGRHDQSGSTTELALWRDLGDDVFAGIARSARIVDSLESVLEGDINFFHAKLTLKRPKVGGAWEWHQDYGYWYRNGFLFPYMASVFIALDPATRENGCLQLIKGSHRMGRIEHGTVAGQVGADSIYVKQALERLPLVHCEMEPGDALFFHCNTLHSSAANSSEHSRNALLCCYNRSDNPSFLSSPDNRTTVIDKLADDGLAVYLDKPIDAQRTFATA
ncbi:MAG: phytanoyl-CoA dioxygenase family protein [Granulosicoccus sp.]|nr:phytanoyl-CoA dioxygenase family protein [Granulosicoccus sp.]